MSHKILEVFCFGGLSIWETFWVKKNGADVDWRSFDNEMIHLNWRAGGEYFPADSSDLRKFGTTGGEDGEEIFWGPATKPMWDFIDQTRMIAMQHRDHFANPPFPEAPNFNSRTLIGPCRHPLASSLAVTGKAVGSPSGVALGTAVQKFFGRNDIAYVIEPNFDRTQIDRSLYDFFFRSQLNQHAGWGQEVLPEFITVTSDLEAQVAARVGPGAFEFRPDTTTPSMVEAARLLKQTDAVHVAVFDLGLQPNGVRWSGYDTHPHNEPEIKTHVELTNNNLFNMLLALRSLIDAGELDLSTTMVRINLEWTRAPWKEQNLLCGCCRNGDNINDGAGTPMNTPGRNHWGYGYVNLLIGGPVSAPGIVGNLEEYDGAGGGIDCGPGKRGPKGAPVHTHTEVYAASLVAMGVNPFQDVFDPQSDPLELQLPFSWLGRTETTNTNLIDRMFVLPPDEVPFSGGFVYF